MTAGVPFELVLDSGSELAEGPVWDADNQTLVWVDILAGRVHRFNPARGTDESTEIGTPVGAAVLAQGGGLVLAVENGFIALDADGAVSQVAPVEADRPDRRMNDGKCDSAGRFWAGTTAYDFEPGASTLWRLDPDRTVTALHEGMVLCNGMGWSPDDSTMYVIDSFAYRIDAYPFDAVTGTLGDPWRLVDFQPGGMPLPDGMTVDADGNLWVAMYGGWELHRYTPAGELDAVVPMPVAQPTSCTFGGANLDELYVTTASQGLSDEDRAAQPGAGGIFRARPGVTGLPSFRFGA